ncbi:MAG: FtsX-like permease family protein [bacterium]|nr:FtsX-like permease family protein [bacterium]
MNRKDNPPKIASWLIKKLSHQYHQRSALGDLEEIYFEMAENEGIKNARRWYRRQALKSIRYFFNSILFWSTCMLKNYLKITFRNIKRYKGYSFLNISGLVIGITCSIIIFLYIQYEFSYDTFHEKADNIYRVVGKEPTNVFMGNNVFVVTQGILAPTLMEEYPEVISATRYRGAGGLLGYKDQWFMERGGIFADENFLKVFSFPLVSGDRTSVLTEPLSIVLTKSLAEKLFGDNDPIGEIIYLNKQQDLKVTGILEDVPENSHVKFNFIVSFATLLSDPNRAASLNRWDSSSYRTYFQLDENTDYKEFENKLVAFVDKYVGERSMSDEGENYSYILQPIKSIHLHSDVNWEFSDNNDIKYIYLYSIIGFFILLIACINYINLATARSLKRIKEIGIRKVVGAQRKQLFVQFIMEAVIFAVFALTISIILVNLLLPFINSIADRNIVMDISGNLQLIFCLSGIIIFVGMVSGIYPAVYVSAFQTVNALRSKGQSLLKNSIMRNVLVTGQFLISIVLIICTIIILNQLNYIKTKELGYDLENVIEVRLDQNYNEIISSLRQELLSNSKILNVSSGNCSPMMIDSKSSYRVEDNVGEMPYKQIYQGYIDYSYINIFDISLSEGRNFSRNYITDIENSVLINEAVVREMGWEEPIGKKIKRSRGEQEFRVIGVLKDFHFMSMYMEIKPLIIHPRVENYSTAFIKMDQGNIPETIDFIKKTTAEFNPGYPFSFSFLTDDYNEMYESEQRLATIFIWFSGLAILIACMGLFGLISFVAESRTKEIGIRKVLGANIPGMIVLLIREFIKLIILANIIAWPVAWISMNNWLSNYAYKIDLGISVFILAGSVSLLIALATISYQSIKASISNPVDSLRYE